MKKMLMDLAVDPDYLDRVGRDNAALELVLHGDKEYNPHVACWIFYKHSVGMFDCDTVLLYDYDVVSFGQRIGGRMVWFPVSDEAIEQLILETVKGWEK